MNSPNFIKKICDSINKIKPIFKSFIFGFLIITSLSILIIGESFSAKTQLELAGNGITNISTHETNGGFYSYMLVENKNKEPGISRAQSEYRFWYDVFNANTQPSRNVYFGVVNGNKEKECHFKDFLSEEPLSFVFSEVNSNYEYNNHWHHEFYNFELLVRGEHYASNFGCYSFCYLTERQAKAYLKMDNPTEEDYLSIIGQKITIVLDDVEYLYLISNIIFENSNVTDSLNEILGNWVMSYIIYPEGFKRQNCYVFNVYTYQNMYKLNYIKNNYPSNDYSYVFGVNNLKESNSQLESNISLVVDYMNENQSIQAIALQITFLLLSFLIQVVVLIYVIKSQFIYSKYGFIPLIVSFVILYIAAYLISRLTKMVIYFSYGFLICYFVSLLVWLATVLISYHFIKKKQIRGVVND